MSDWPTPLSAPAKSVISCVSPTAGTAAAGAGFGSAAVWPAANRAIYWPFTVETACAAKKIAWLNGGTVGAFNVDVGIYDINAARLVSAGPTALGSASVVQVADITDTPLTPGIYFAAMSVDSNTPTFQRVPTSAAALRVMGVQQEASAATLPSTATFANPASAYLPWMSIALTATI